MKIDNEEIKKLDKRINKGSEKSSEKGSEHYKTKGVEPFDLYKAGDMMRDFCVGNIIKYAFRNRRELNKPVNPKDIDKIIHYAEELGKLS